MNKLILKQDSRDVHVADHFGSIDAIPLEIEFDKTITNPVEDGFGINCTAISATDVCANQTGTIYSIDDLWALTPHTSEGATPQDSLGALVKHGLQPTNGGPRDTRWQSYFRSDGKSGDYFATTQASMIMAQSATTIASNWYREWSFIGPDGVLPPGKTYASGHDYEVTGWRQTDTGPQFHVKHWRGWKVWMPKDVFNKEMDMYGTGAYIPTTKQVDIATKSLLQSLIDACINLVLLLQRQLLSLSVSKTPVPVLETLPPVLDPVIGPIIHPITPTYLWDNYDDARHSVRVICDEEGLTLANKNLICACIEQESHFDNTAKNYNRNSQGQVTSVDWGICQINDFYQTGLGKPFQSGQEIVDNPDKAVRFMIRMFKAGKLRLWVSFSSGAYLRYLK